MEFGVACSSGYFSPALCPLSEALQEPETGLEDRKSTRLNSSHLGISYAVFCLKKKYLTSTDRLDTRPFHAPHACRCCVIENHCLVPRCWQTRASRLIPGIDSRLFFFLIKRRPRRLPLFPAPTPSR